MDLLDVSHAEHLSKLLTGRHFDFSLTGTGLVVQMDGRELFFRPFYLPYPKEIDVVGQIGAYESVVVFCEKLSKDVGNALRNQGFSYLSRWGHVFLRASGLQESSQPAKEHVDCSTNQFQLVNREALANHRYVFWRIQR